LSILFNADNDLKPIIADATPDIDFLTAQSARLDDLNDEAVLRLDGSHSRNLVPSSLRTLRSNVIEALIMIWADDCRTLVAKVPF